MKVKLATQTISKSVSNAILCLCEDLKLNNFAGAEATAKFLKVFDESFDWRNSRYRFGKFSKASLKKSNEDCWRSFFKKAKGYNQGLKYIDGKSIFTPNRCSAAFLGWLVNFSSLEHILEYCVQENNLNYILVYMMSQDPLEAAMAIEESSETSDFFPELFCYGQSDSEYKSNVTV